MNFTERANIAHKVIETEGGSTPNVLSALLLCGGIVLMPQATAVSEKAYSIDIKHIPGTTKIADASIYTSKHEAHKKMVARLRELRRQYIAQGGALLSAAQILEEIKKSRGE